MDHHVSVKNVWQTVVTMWRNLWLMTMCYQRINTLYARGRKVYIKLNRFNYKMLSRNKNIFFIMSVDNWKRGPTLSLLIDAGSVVYLAAIKLPFLKHSSHRWAMNKMQERKTERCRGIPILVFRKLNSQ